MNAIELKQKRLIEIEKKLLVFKDKEAIRHLKKEKRAIINRINEIKKLQNNSQVGWTKEKINTKDYHQIDYDI